MRTVFHRPRSFLPQRACSLAPLPHEDGMYDQANDPWTLGLGFAALALLTLGGRAVAADEAAQDFRAVFAAARKAVSGGNVTTTRLAGVDVSRTTFRETPDEGAVLVGFEVGLDKFGDDD